MPELESKGIFIREVIILHRQSTVSFQRQRMRETRNDREKTLREKDRKTDRQR